MTQCLLVDPLRAHQLKLRIKVCFRILGVLIRSMKEGLDTSLALSSLRVCSKPSPDDEEWPSFIYEELMFNILIERE